MAALTEAEAPVLTELSDIRPEAMERLLDEEARTWQATLDWDFRPSADLVRRFVRMKALSGYALCLADEAVGYSYFVAEESKALIGDLYVSEPYRCPALEDLLWRSVLDATFSSYSVRRVEAQLMLLPSSLQRAAPHSAHVTRNRRDFMAIDADRIEDLGAAPPRSDARIVPWKQQSQEEAATVVARAYEGHVDSDINDQYRSLAGARRFLLNIVQYPGCGAFFQEGSFVALLPGTPRICGISLASLVAADVGHITQICITPEARGMGIGRALLWHSLNGLLRNGCRKASLTVTHANQRALRLYERVGFRTIHSFGAFVWEGFR